MIWPPPGFWNQTVLRKHPFSPTSRRFLYKQLPGEPGAEATEGKNYKPKQEFAYRMRARPLHGCCEMSCHVVWCDVMWCDAMWCHVLWCNVIASCDALSCDELWSVVKWCDAMGWGLLSLWCDVAGCEVTLCGSKWFCDVVNWKMMLWSYYQVLKARHSTTKYYFVLQSGTPYCKVLSRATKYYSILQSTNPYISVLRSIIYSVW